MKGYIGKKVKDIMTPKEDLVTFSPRATVKEATVKMIERDVGSILITVENKLVGIFTERDVVRCASKDVSLDRELEDIMTKDLILVKENEGLSKAAYLMSENNIRHLPVVDEKGDLVGIISARDIARFYGGVVEASEFIE